MRFKLLGQFEIVADEGPILLTQSKISQLLGLLLIQNGETVSVDSLIEELWGEDMPRSALTTLQTYVYHARKMFAALSGGKDILVTRPSGYAIEVADESVDVRAYIAHVDKATKAYALGDVESVIDHLDATRKLWRGPFLVGIPKGQILDAYVTYLKEVRLTALELDIEIKQRTGNYRGLIPQLRLLVAENPLNENLHAQLIKVLHKCGRRAEALAAYRDLWQVLDAELGVRPTSELQSIQQELLTEDRVAY
ncbi:AfsR/SARP family transcriptional regulator [Nocardia sp. XZ_19_369]|uniref:AfsR/SARP family transcriptional regulator n=1 Tax=Nocardia sp. XZ_19_369 TaxID=2769487 RepID=UPI0018905CF4|nr:AfsR/SARP family transcriptional regulator [Nocardia sp. XZ_19_369]